MNGLPHGPARRATLYAVSFLFLSPRLHISLSSPVLLLAYLLPSCRINLILQRHPQPQTSTLGPKCAPSGEMRALFGIFLYLRGTRPPSRTPFLSSDLLTCMAGSPCPALPLFHGPQPRVLSLPGLLQSSFVSLLSLQRSRPPFLLRGFQHVCSLCSARSAG